MRMSHHWWSHLLLAYAKWILAMGQNYPLITLVILCFTNTTLCDGDVDVSASEPITLKSSHWEIRTHPLITPSGLTCTWECRHVCAPNSHLPENTWAQNHDKRNPKLQSLPAALLPVYTYGLKRVCLACRSDFLLFALQLCSN